MKREELISFMLWYKNNVPIGTMKRSKEIVDEYIDSLSYASDLTTKAEGEDSPLPWSTKAIDYVNAWEKEKPHDCTHGFVQRVAEVDKPMTAEKFYLNYYGIEKLPRHRVICDASEIIELMNQYSALRKVEMPSEEDVDKEFPITSETKAVTLSYQANQMAKREGAKWAIEQIKHLNKLT